MKRTKFVLSSLTAIFSFAFLQARTPNDRPNKGFLVKGGENRIQRHVDMGGRHIIDIKVSKDDTDKDLTVLEVIGKTALDSTPLHVHHSQDETFYILEGEYIFQLQQERFELKAGDTIFLPRTIPHAWLQKSEKGKLLAIVQPSGKIEEFAFAMESIKQPPSAEQLKKIFEDSEISIVGPRIKLKE